MRRTAPALLLACLAACNRYDLFRLSGYEQESFSNKADVLFVVDNSDSMVDEVAALATNFEEFVTELQEREEALPTDGLTDAVRNYQAYVRDRAAFLDYQFALTTTDVEEEGGALVGSPEILSKGDDKLARRFTRNLLCEATCWSDNSFDDPDIEYTASDLDDICGAGTWLDQNCGAAQEEPIEAAYLALCRAVPNPPSECFEGGEVTNKDGSIDTYEPVLRRADAESNAGLVRDGATFIPVLVTDEGDDSRRLASGEGLPQAYLDLFAKFSRHVVWVAIAPPLNPDGTAACTGYTDWQAARMDVLVDNSNGLKIDIADADRCKPADFDAALQELGELISNLITNFELQSVPVVETILVFVEGEEVALAPTLGTDQFGIPLFGDGWSYVPESNSIAFHGSAVPSNDALVQVYYEPLDGMPRELPF